MPVVGLTHVAGAAAAGAGVAVAACCAGSAEATVATPSRAKVTVSDVMTPPRRGRKASRVRLNTDTVTSNGADACTRLNSTVSRFSSGPSLRYIEAITNRPNSSTSDRVDNLHFIRLE